MYANKYICKIKTLRKMITRRSNKFINLLSDHHLPKIILKIVDKIINLSSQVELMIPVT